eukprot:scaffold113915_cov19-Tisochrysis_lutea.AAC.1
MLYTCCHQNARASSLHSSLTLWRSMLDTFLSACHALKLCYPLSLLSCCFITYAAGNVFECHASCALQSCATRLHCSRVALLLVPQKTFLSVSRDARSDAVLSQITSLDIDLGKDLPERLLFPKGAK